MDDVGELVTQWRYDARVDRGPATVDNYMTSIGRFRDWLTDNGHPATTDSFNRTTVRGFLADLRDAGLAPKTVRLHYMAVQVFGRWLVAEGELDADPTANVARPKLRTRPGIFLTISA